MAWRKEAPAVFLRVENVGPQQSGFLQEAAPVGSVQQELLNDYVNGGESLWFNNYLRGLRMEELTPRDKKEYRKKTQTLNKLINEAPASRHKMILFRAISEDAPRFQKYKKGDDADINKGIISTSTSYDAALTFLEDDESCCMLVIMVPRNTYARGVG